MAKWVMYYGNADLPVGTVDWNGLIVGSTYKVVKTVHQKDFMFYVLAELPADFHFDATLFSTPVVSNMVSNLYFNRCYADCDTVDTFAVIYEDYTLRDETMQICLDGTDFTLRKFKSKRRMPS